MPQAKTGFLLHVFQRTLKGQPVVYALGKLESGETFGLVERRVRPYFFVRQNDIEQVQEELGHVGAGYHNCVQRTMAGEAVVQVHADNMRKIRRAADLVHAHELPSYEADVSLAKRYLINRGIRGPAVIEGLWQKGREVDWVTVDPDLHPSDWEPDLAVLSIDIETDPDATLVTAVSLVSRGPLERNATEEVHVVGEAADDDAAEPVHCHPDEASMLRAFADRVSAIDPDVITGWNVIDFDLQVLERRFRDLGIPFQLGRSLEKSEYREGARWGGSRAHVPGRQVLDALHLVRHTLNRFDDYRLDTVAKAILGRGKILHDNGEESMPELIERVYREDKQLFAEYCLEDARLVLDLLEKEDLIRLTLRRSVLTGLSLERAWGSVAAFEFLYLSELHRRNIVAPTAADRHDDGEAAPGGFVFMPDAGLFRNTFVFDFKSLYPSIIRTFNIDPLAHARAKGLPKDEVIEAPNGARFHRERGILPQMLDVFFERRATARAEDNKLAAYTYKILMNSFYGVLGTKSCRFASNRLAGAITRFGHHLLKWSRDLLESEGCSVLYGDTDSLFVDAGLPDDVAPELAFARAEQLRDLVNDKLASYVREEYGVESKLELEFEKYYRRFLLPPSRGQTKKGRAKGYAGLRHESAGEESLDIVGMEAVRRDWTVMAHEFQRHILDRLFRDTPVGEIEAFISDWVADLRNGDFDDKLIYHKALRKDVAKYTKTTPPHVRAARLLPKPDGVIHYLITRHGPQPVGYVNSPLDYSHYIDKQIEPIIRSIAHFIDLDVAGAITGEQWLL